MRKIIFEALISFLLSIPIVLVLTHASFSLCMGIIAFIFILFIARLVSKPNKYS